MPGERLVTIGIRKDLTDKIKYTFPKPHDYKPVLRDVLFDCPDSPQHPLWGEKEENFRIGSCGRVLERHRSKDSKRIYEKLLGYGRRAHWNFAKNEPG
jgi:hypothetical protein